MKMKQLEADNWLFNILDIGILETTDKLIGYSSVYVCMYVHMYVGMYVCMYIH